MKTKKIIAPILITIVLCIYFISFVAFSFYFNIPFLWKVIGAVIPFALIGACIFLLIERIKEIRSGEEDDLSEY